MDKKYGNVTISRDTKKRLKMVAAEQGVSMLELLEQLIDHYLDGEKISEQSGSSSQYAAGLLGARKSENR